MTTLREKILTPNRPVILYELIPPPANIKAVNLHAYADCSAELLDNCDPIIDGINIPEIRDEKRKATPRQFSYKNKTDARKFAKHLQKSSKMNLGIVLNRCTIYEDWPLQFDWLAETTKKYGIDNLVLVGGESSRIKYPGPSVIEMGKTIQKKFNSLFCGGITISSRRNNNLLKDEPYRLIEKGRHGMEYFISQVIYEPYEMQKLIKDYYLLCVKKELKPKRIFLSFAPISTRRDLEFLRWLGVIIPDPVQEVLFGADIGIGWRSVKIAKVILQKILAFVRDENIQVPLGLNVEHISMHNFELSREFLEELGKIYNQSFDTKYHIF